MQVDIVQTFKDTFHRLTKSKRRVFEAIHWFAQTFDHVYPSVDKIAHHAGTSARTVKRATKDFADQGFVAKVKIGYGTNEYFMDDKLIALDIKNPNTFKKKKCHPVGPVYISNKEYIDSTTGGGTFSDDSKEKIPLILQIPGLLYGEAMKIRKMFSDAQIMHAVTQMQNKERRGTIIHSACGFLIHAAKSYWGNTFKKAPKEMQIIHKIFHKGERIGSYEFNSDEFGVGFALVCGQGFYGWKFSDVGWFEKFCDFCFSRLNIKIFESS